MFLLYIQGFAVNLSKNRFSLRNFLWFILSFLFEFISQRERFLNALWNSGHNLYTFLKESQGHLRSSSFFTPLLPFSWAERRFHTRNVKKRCIGMACDHLFTLIYDMKKVRAQSWGLRIKTLTYRMKSDFFLLKKMFYFLAYH